MEAVCAILVCLLSALHLSDTVAHGTEKALGMNLEYCQSLTATILKVNCLAIPTASCPRHKEAKAIPSKTNSSCKTNAHLF